MTKRRGCDHANLNNDTSGDSLKFFPAVILTASDSEIDVVKSYQLRANCYPAKPAQLEAFESHVKSIDDFWLTGAKLPRQREPL